MLGNQFWKDRFPSVEVHFQCEGEYDHSPTVLTIHPIVQRGKRSFRYFTMWKDDTKFLEKMRQAWSTYVVGSNMFQVVTKLKEVKKLLRVLEKRALLNCT